MHFESIEKSELKRFRLKDSTIETPGCVLYSRGGMVPHLTSDNLECVTAGKSTIWQMPLSTVFEQPGMNTMQTFGKSFHEFSSTQDKVLFLNASDSYVERPEVYKYNEEKSISIWTPGGRRKITPEEYMKCLQTFSFDVCIPPSDTVPEGVAKKRCHKSSERTIRFLDKCLQIKLEQKLSVPFLGVVEGGDSIYEREKCAKDVASRNVEGFLLSGFDLIPTKWKELLQLCLKHLPKEKVKIMFGLFTPVEVVEAIQLGVDIFGTAITYDVTQRGCALCFKYKNKKRHLENDNCTGKGSGPAKEYVDKEKPEKRIGTKGLGGYEIDLNNKRYSNETVPLVDGCPCYCCTRYVRAYIHHLLATKEMLAQVLLMMHNLHYWLAFFKEIRCSIAENRLEELKEILLSSPVG